MLGQLVLWALAGWCGTPWGVAGSGSWISRGLIGIVGGIIGGFLVTQLMPNEHVAASVFGALATGRVLSDIVGGISNKA